MKIIMRGSAGRRRQTSCGGGRGFPHPLNARTALKIWGVIHRQVRCGASRLPVPPDPAGIRGTGKKTCGKQWSALPSHREQERKNHNPETTLQRGILDPLHGPTSRNPLDNFAAPHSGGFRQRGANGLPEAFRTAFHSPGSFALMSLSATSREF